MGARDITVRRHHHAFAGGKLIVFHHPCRVAGGRPEPVHGSVQIRWVVDDFAFGGAHTGGQHDLLGERLGTFDLGGVLARPEADDASSAHRVGHSEHQRHLGSDDHQVGVDIASQGDDVIAGGDVDVVLLGQPGRAGVAGSDDQPRDLWVLAERQQQGMFTGTGTDHQDAHDTSD